MAPADRPMKTKDIRQAFLDFFAEREHRVVPSSSLVPANDPTLLFTNSGMVQFKNAFLGLEEPAAPRIVDVQRCLRAGGKHNDLENVGYTARHHTFFEMLGNWSFGDYFKRDAIIWAWELLVDVFKLPADRLWVTVYETDDEAYDIWKDVVGVPAERIVRIGDNKGAPYASDNFWQMADTGPCGPSSEIFYDHGPDVAGGPPGSPDEDGDRYIEIWNLVFMQYDRDTEGKLTPLPAPCVDTGMGLERIAAVLQGVHSNYEIDLFGHLIEAAAKAVGTKDLHANSLRVIADHIRATAFLIADGVLPSNEGRGYVLRRIMRRAIRHGYQLGQDKPFFHKLVNPLVAEMSEAYPELAKAEKKIERAILDEEKRFAQTLGQGMQILEADIAAIQGKQIPGEVVFKLYDTYGFPADLTADLARERGLTVDMPGFEREMDKQRKRARAASQFNVGISIAAQADLGFQATVTYPTEFSGYDSIETKAKVRALFHNGQQVNVLHMGEEAAIVLNRTPFYAESGGQVGDTGTLSGGETRFIVNDTQQSSVGRLHIGTLEKGTLNVDDAIEAKIDAERRAAIVGNHSATHLLHAALRKVLGDHVTQKGSLVAPDRLRFDFSHNQPVTHEELTWIEDMVNAEIRRNVHADVRQMSYDEAIDFGAMALFGEKYGETVRVLKFGDFSTELCGGTHVARTGDIGLFRIIGESGVAAGIRRIEAVTSDGALAYVRKEQDKLDAVAAVLKTDRDDAVRRAQQLVARNRELEKELAALRAKLASGQGSDLASQAEDVNGIKVLSVRVDSADAGTLRDMVDQLKNKLGSGVVVLGAVDAGKVRLAAGATRDVSKEVPAGKLVNHVAGQVGGRGGGRPDFAQAGGSEPDKLDDALASVRDWVAAQLKQ